MARSPTKCGDLGADRSRFLALCSLSCRLAHQVHIKCAGGVTKRELNGRQFTGDHPAFSFCPAYPVITQPLGRDGKASGIARIATIGPFILRSRLFSKPPRPQFRTNRPRANLLRESAATAGRKTRHHSHAPRHQLRLNPVLALAYRPRFLKPFSPHPCRDDMGQRGAPNANRSGRLALSLCPAHEL